MRAIQFIRFHGLKTTLPSAFSLQGTDSTDEAMLQNLPRRL